MPFDNTGFTPLPKGTILSNLNTQLILNVQQELGDNTVFVDTSDETLFGKLNNIIADRLANIYSVADQLETSMDAVQATGSALEKLALQVGFYRFPNIPSTGIMYIFGDEDTTLPLATKFANLRGDSFETDEVVTISRESCLGLRTQVGELRNNQQYSVYINASPYNFTADADATHAEILQGLATQINTFESRVVATFFDTPDPLKPEDAYLLVDVVDKNSPLFINLSAFLVDSYIQSSVVANASVAGIVFGDAFTITTIQTGVNGLVEVYNPDDFIIGSYQETDEQLRERVLTDFNSVGSGTPSTIQALIDRRDDVNSCLVLENPTYVDAVDTGIPAKRYEVVVDHDTTDIEIATLVWDTKPLGIEPFGTVTETIFDSSNTPRDVQFTNATKLYATVRVSYSLHAEEVFPINGEILMRDALTAEMAKLGINQDVIPKRYVGTLYSTASGIDDVVITVGLAPDPVTTPTSFEAIRAPIDYREVASFASNRMEFTQV